MTQTMRRLVVAAGILTAQNAFAQPVECPDGWYETSGRCFRVFDFGENQKQSWESAMATCSAHGTPLATIHNHEEESLIQSLSARYKAECWTGLRKYKRFKPDKGWLWIDRDVALNDDDYLHWGTEWQSVWKILPPDEKCGTIKQDGWGNRPCWGPGSKLQCFVCGTLDPEASEQAKKAFQNDFSTGNWWVPPPLSNQENNVGNNEDGWNIEALGTGDSVAIEDPNTFWDPSSENGGSIDPNLLRTTIPPTTMAPSTTTLSTTTPSATTTTPPTTTRRTTTTTTVPTTTTTTKKPTTTTTTTRRPTTTTTTRRTTTTTTRPPTTTTTTPPPTTTRPSTTTPPTTTTMPPTTTITTRPPTTTRTISLTEQNRDFDANANDISEEVGEVVEDESSIITGLAIAVGSVAAAVATGAGIVAYKRHRNRRLSTSIESSPEAQSFTDVEQ